MKCCQCSNPAMWLATEMEIPLCLNCYLKFSQITQAELEEHERWINYLSDQIAFTVGMPSMSPRFPARPRPIHIGDVKLNNITVSNSVVGTINTGSIGVVDQSISALIQVGEPELADAVKELSQAIINSGDLSAIQKNELVEILSVVAAEAATPKGNRRNSVAKALIDRASQIMALANDVADVCQKWWPALLAVFQTASG